MWPRSWACKRAKSDCKSQLLDRAPVQRGCRRRTATPDMSVPTTWTGLCSATRRSSRGTRRSHRRKCWLEGTLDGDALCSASDDSCLIGLPGGQIWHLDFLEHFEDQRLYGCATTIGAPTAEIITAVNESKGSGVAKLMVGQFS